MTRGILYFNHGERCLVRLLVSLHTLRRHYSGPVAIACEGNPPEWFRDMTKALKAEIITAPQSDEYGLLKKSRIWRVSPFDHTLFLDADTVVRAPVDELLELTQRHSCVQTRFNDWHTHRGRMRRRIEQWRAVDPALVEAAIKYGKAINTGVQGWTKGDPILDEYEKLTARGLAARTIGRKTLDEIAMQLLLPHHRHYTAGSEWNCGGQHGEGAKAKIIHYHGHKHCRDGPNGDIWKAEFWELVRAFPQHAAQLTGDPRDDSVALWLKKEFGRRKDLTIVTAVNPAYAAKAKANIAKWLATPGLKDQQFIVFVNGFRNAAERKFLEYPNVKVIRWDYPFKASPRETMLAAFVLGVAEHVRTEYWMKLDADASPKQPFFLWPDYSRHTIVSHKWGYTKMKGDPDAKDHWFNRLDRLGHNSQPFPRLDPKKDFKVNHRPGNKLGIPMRFGSFAHIERTSFTRRIADVVKQNGGRLPIPSQDTLAWYCACVWKEPVKLLNMKKWFSP